MVLRFRALAATAAVALFGASQAFAATDAYDFFPVVGDNTPTTIQIASFSSPADPGAYTFSAFDPTSLLFSKLGPDVLVGNGVTATELDITFAAPQDAISFDFALVDLLDLSGNDFLDVALDGGTPQQFNTTIPASDLFPQGTVSLSGTTPFTSVEITSGNPSNTIAIADLTTAPEPASIAVLGAGLAGLAAARRRRG